MKLNKKGFTLIESIITFAILAIAGGMFILGFYNVSVIASEGSIIKTETNNLYNYVVSTEPGDIEPPYSLIFTFDDNITSELKCWAVEGESKLGDETNELVIRLSRYVPAVSLDEWAEPETSDSEMINPTIRFRLCWPMSANKNIFPYDIKVNLNNNSIGGIARNFYTDQNNLIKIKKNTADCLYNEQYILNSLNKFPTSQEIQNSIISPQDMGDEIIWYQIQKQSDGSYDVIGFKVPYPFPFPNWNIILDKKGYIIFETQTENWSENMKESFESIMMDKQAKSIRDGKLYTSKERRR